MKIIVTGGAGFIGSCFVRLAVQDPSYDIVNIDKLTYAGNLETMRAHRVERFIHVSTDEVYGSLEPPLEADEQFPLQPTSSPPLTKKPPWPAW